MKKFNRTQQMVKELLEKRFDYIEKWNAIKYVRDQFGISISLSDIVKAYNSIEKFNF